MHSVVGQYSVHPNRETFFLLKKRGGSKRYWGSLGVPLLWLQLWREKGQHSQHRQGRKCLHVLCLGCSPLPVNWNSTSSTHFCKDIFWSLLPSCEFPSSYKQALMCLRSLPPSSNMALIKKKGWGWGNWPRFWNSGTCSFLYSTPHVSADSQCKIKGEETKWFQGFNNFHLAFYFLHTLSQP